MQYIWLFLLTEVIGIRKYYDEYNSFFEQENDPCPEMHTLKVDFSPDYCVSYNEICIGALKASIKIDQNGDSFLCQPRFQVWDTGSPTKDYITMHCGFNGGDQLVMELLTNGHYQYYCTTLYDDANIRCLITTLVQGFYRCLFCKHPYYGESCSQTIKGYDQRYFNPPKKCINNNCLECQDDISCSKCIPGKGSKSNKLCDIDCRGFQDCSMNSNGIIQYNSQCMIGYYLYSGTTCKQCNEGCLSCSYDPIINYPGCSICDSNYFRKLVYQNVPNIYGCFRIENCDKSRQQITGFSISSNGLYSYNIQCNLCDFTYYYDTESGECEKISKQNQFCQILGLNPENCFACHPLYERLPDATCQIRVCNPFCLTCLDNNPNKCITCREDRNYNSYTCQCKTTNTCECLDGFCYECEQPDIFYCTSCKPGSNRILVDKQCVCPPGYQVSTSNPQNCILCDHSCKFCSGPSNSECITCPKESTSNRIKVDGLCICKPGYADYEIKQSKCGKCHSKCKSCYQAADDTQNQYCLTCIPGQNRVLSDDFNCDCKNNYGDFNGTLDVCLKCHYTCGSCNDFGSNNCTLCLPSSHRYLTLEGKCLCKSSYFDDQTDSIVCAQCHYSCLLCANKIEKDACQQCSQTRIPSNPSAAQFECICSSPDTFDDGFSPICQNCHYSCLTCNGPLPSNCLTCNTNYRQLNLFNCMCPIGFYDVGSLECAQCHYSCYSCYNDSIESCVTCSLDLHYRVLKGLQCFCADGYYEDSGIALCKKCSYKCETCQTLEDKCLSCPSNSFRIFDPVQGCYCPEEYFDKYNESTCLKCHFKCQTCNGITEQSCLTCDPVFNRILNVNQCECKKHYFDMEVSECIICSEFCYECKDNSQKCTSCYQNRYLDNSTCKCLTKIQGITISTFEYNNMVDCQKCHYSCAMCKGFDLTDCISCIDSEERFLDANTCLCKEGYYDAGMPDCKKCSYKCKECYKSSETCTSCKDNSFRLYKSGLNKCQCIDSYFDDGENEVCQKCHYSCLRCNDIETRCEICSIESNRTFNDQIFTCDCNEGYYDDGVQICQKCHYSCLNCTFGDSNTCISCLDSNISHRVYYNNTCKCFFGYFDDAQSVICQKCDINCLSCIDQAYKCLSCPQTRKIQTNCKCEQGYYDVGLQFCSKCNSNCMTCEIKSNNCTSCDLNLLRELNIITQTCDCLLGYIEINGICQQCHQNCKTCSQSINNCISCVKFRYLIDNQCFCNDGMYESNLDKQCKLCDKTCLTCISTNTNCLTCSIENFREFKSGNKCECMQGFYENPINKNCEECEKSCLICSLVYDNCLSCDSNLNLNLINNKCLCSSSYYFDSLTKSCKQCNINCLECENSTECLTCILSTRHFDYVSKQCLCNTGYFEINQQNCKQCHYSCETCENNNTNCLSCLDIHHRKLINSKCLCFDGYYEVGIEQCWKCSNICKTCESSAQNCKTCYEIEQKRYYSEYKCLCNPGYFESNEEICTKCSNECLTCQGQADYCTSCDILAKRLDQSIIHKCPCIIGFYQDQNLICQKCHIKCQTCINKFDQCLSCKFELNSNRKSLSNQCNCKDGYFDDGTQLQCQKCSLKCKTCKNQANYCIICQNTVRIHPPQCDCLDGYFEDQQLTCQICDPQCNTCVSSPSNCLSCKPGRSGNDCKCIDGYLEIGQILCEKCGFQCATCDQSRFNCKVCKGNRIQEPKCICQSGYFDDQINEDCQQCDSTCIECNINGCLSCSANRILNEKMVCIPPPNSIWHDNTPWCSTCQVAVVKVQLSDDISKIIIHFDFPLNSKGFNSQIEINKCMQIFESESVLIFGQTPVCYLNPDNNQELLIQLGDNSKINIGDDIQFKSNSLSHVNCESALQKFIFTTLQMPINPIPPLIEYNVPLDKINPYAETLVYVKSMINTGNKKLNNIFWSCQVNASEKNDKLQEFLDQNNFNQEYNLLIPEFTLIPNAVLKFKIQYSNFIHLNSFSEFTILTHSGEQPQIYINYKQSYFVFEKISISISVGTLFKSNIIDNSKYSINLFEINRHPKKSLSSQLNISTESNSFEFIYANISKYTLSPNSTYTFQIKAQNQMTNIFEIKNFTIQIPFAGLYCKFNHMGIQYIRKNLSLQVECVDFDRTYDWNSDPDLNIEISCKDITLSGTCINLKKENIHINTTEINQFIDKNSIAPFTVQEWTVEAKKFQQEAKFNLIIVYLEDDLSFLELDYNKGYLMRKINNYELLNFTYLIPFTQKPYLVDQQIAIIYEYEIIEILQPKYISHSFKLFNILKELRYGDKINLKLTAQYSNNIMPSMNNIKLTLNRPPVCQKILINNQSDLALTNIIVLISCMNSADSPYKYQLKIFLREVDLQSFLEGQLDNSLTLKPYQNNNQFQIQVPTSVDSSKIGILVQILDNGGSITQIYETIAPKPAQIDCAQIQFQNLNLQNKIVMLFESMNLKCTNLHKQIYNDLLYLQILQNQMDNILKFQAIKLYQQFSIFEAQSISQNLGDLNENRCFDLNSSSIVVTSQKTQTTYDTPQLLKQLKENSILLNSTLKYFQKMKNQSEEELLENQYIWNEEIYEQLQYSLTGMINLVYYFDEIYSSLSKINQKQIQIYQTIDELLKIIEKVGEEIQNTIIVNNKAFILQGNEIIWQMKRTKKQLFNYQFHVESTKEDYLIDFIQLESIHLKSNPLRFMPDLDNILQKQFKVQKLQIYPKSFYKIQFKNIYKGRYILFEDFQSVYSTSFESFSICQSNIQTIEQHQIQCIQKTLSGQFYLCDLTGITKNAVIEIRCECSRFGEIFLVSSTNFTLTNVDISNEIILNYDMATLYDYFTDLIASTGTLTLIFFIIYVYQLIKNFKYQLQTEETIPTRRNLDLIDQNKMMYRGFKNIFKINAKLIHQSISLFYYKDKNIHLSYRILEISSQFQILLTLAIIECYKIKIINTYIIVFIIANPILLMILRIFYKIIEAIYRFKRIAAFISQFILIIFLMLPNLILLILYLFKTQIQSEKYLIAIIHSGSVIISQVLVEPFIIGCRIILYRLIATSLKNMELNPFYHLIHFFVMHSSLEEIFDEFSRI
ncbi:unnamed protein product [Paramecium sonneborni]|uniref:EGF-like domain-containing protein n=1 Tax=Paramecium sonneborni TaxID=65129 RepID=A0A8S1RC78_9CILI|nr:unnamed protein product [Paramecium sonneborni]